MMFLYFQVWTIVFISRIKILKLKKHGTCTLTSVLMMSDMVLFLITVKGCHIFKQADLAFDFMSQSERNKQTIGKGNFKLTCQNLSTGL